ncbi:hypothetical protein KCP73_21460 [Salmonella enterica subsp. enterica]|nr:hypothetical protein KCP73_21460 [Salmonella enterica subsp. enterica]
MTFFTSSPGIQMRRPEADKLALGTFVQTNEHRWRRVGSNVARRANCVRWPAPQRIVRQPETRRGMMIMSPSLSLLAAARHYQQWWKFLRYPK